MCCSFLFRLLKKKKRFYCYPDCYLFSALCNRTLFETSKNSLSESGNTFGSDFQSYRRLITFFRERDFQTYRRLISLLSRVLNKRSFEELTFNLTIAWFSCLFCAVLKFIRHSVAKIHSKEKLTWREIKTSVFGAICGKFSCLSGP